MQSLGTLKRGLRTVGFVNSSVRTGECYVSFTDTESHIVFDNKWELDKWLDELGLKLK